MVKQERLRIKDQIANGNYRVSSEKLAEKVLENIIEKVLENIIMESKFLG